MVIWNKFILFAENLFKAMKYNITNLSLPPFAFLDSAFNPTLNNRNCILHVRSASVTEVLNYNQLLTLNDNVISYRFSYCDEDLIAILHYCTTIEDKDDIIKLVLKPLAEWYCQYCEWEDKNIANDCIADAN